MEWWSDGVLARFPTTHYSITPTPHSSIGSSDPGAHPDPHALAPDLAHHRARTSTPITSRFRSHADPGVFLQRHFLHLRPGPDAVLRCACAKCRRLLAAVCNRECSRTNCARSSFRYDRPPKNDYRDLRDRRPSACRHRLAFSRGNVDRADANDCMDDHLLRRL